MNLNTMEVLGGAVGSALGGGGISSFFTWLSNRKSTDAKAQAYAQGAVDHAVKTAMDSVSSQLERTDLRLEHSDVRLALIEARERECVDKLAVMINRLDVSERDRAELRAHLDQLMAAPVAGVFDKPVG